ncbi:MAG: four helix bundle protein [Acidobacteriota bacterium]|nr:four helix bundle protein [Acidobacteriota bacterium]
MSVSSYKQLVVWQKAIELVLEVYRATQDFPKEEMYGLTSQLRRAAVSVPSNIAEGQGRSSTGEFKQFLGHAKGSLFELQTQAVIAQKLGYLKGNAAAMLLDSSDEVG